MIQYYSVENTGWSNGVSWYTTGGTDMNPSRFTSNKEATAYATRCKELNDDTNTLWRIVHTTIERTQNQEVLTRTWVLI